MVDSTVVVWVMDLAGVGIGVEGRSAWVSDRWVFDRVGLSWWLFIFFLFRLLVVMRLWVCDLVVILEGYFSFSFSGCWW